MTKQIKLTKKLFFDTLPKLRKYKPVITRFGFIRFGKRNKGYEMCPLTAFRKELTGVAGDMYKAEDYFPSQFGGDVVSASDNNPAHKHLLRNKMIKLLGLGLEK